MEIIMVSVKDYYEIALSYLSPRISCLVRKSAPDGADEIRLTNGAECIIVKDGKNKLTGAVCGYDDMDYTVRRVSGNSLYAHESCIAEGYITSSDGIRVGVAGRAVCDGGKIVSVSDISSVVIRIPSRRLGAADTLYGLMAESSFKINTLIYSPPSGGKTTVLRELVYRLASGERTVRVAVVDTRCEICEGLAGLPVTRLAYYPRDVGTEIALRTLSPEIIVCDEMYGEAELRSLEKAYGSGVTCVVTAHASSYGEVKRKLEYSGCRVPFGLYYGVSRQGDPEINFEE